MLMMTNNIFFKLGSGKSLLLLCECWFTHPSRTFLLNRIVFFLALLGEADLLSGQICCPRSPPDAIASFEKVIPPPEEWVVPGLCAYVPQAAWLRNASIKDNILFNLPYVEDRYKKTLEVSYSSLYASLSMKVNIMFLFSFLSLGLCVGQRSENLGRWRRS